ncbi:ABC transporter permease [Williamsia muralis]|uniref:ABC transporter permease n=2 Tax=Williamsia marianensis TaxID=85044 RepID=A0ABU4ETA2_WILMA|nr:ABC transporter permease [Williamsia muralis]MDV7134485.1 ABC transporter permease [Williamsia muralis]
MMATATVTPALDLQTRSVTAPKSARSRSHWLTVWPLRILVLVAAAGLWQFLTTADVVLWARFDTVPSVTDIAQAFWTSLGTEEYYLDLGQSLIRIGAGFALAVGVGVPVGILLGRSRIATNTVGTLTEVLRPIPAIALVPVAILVLPTDEAGMVFITFVAAFFPISVATRHAVRALPTIWEDSVLTMGGRKRDVILRVVLPGIAPGVFSGLSVGIGVAWICLISAEMISGRLGVGYRTWQAYTVVDYPQVFVGMLTIGILGALTSGGIELIGRRLTRWLPRAQETR